MSGFTLTPTNPVTDPVRPPAGKYRHILGDGTNGTQNLALYRMDSTGAIALLQPPAYTPEQAQDDAFGIFADSNTVDATYDDAGNVFSAEVRIPVVTFSGASKVYGAADNGRYYRRSNGGSPMTDTLPAGPPHGFYIKVQNLETAVANTLTVSASGGATIGEAGATTNVVKYGCRQTYIYDATNNAWRFDAGNTNLLKTYAGAAAGDLLTPLDAAGVGVAKATAAQVAAACAAATEALQGAMSAADKTTLDHIWYDVTNYGVSTSNTGAQNMTALQALVTAAGQGSTFFFPQTPGNYPLSGTLTVASNYVRFKGAGMRTSVIFCDNTTQDLFAVANGARNVTFEDLGLWATAVATAGACIRGGTPSGSGNPQLNIYRCGWESFGGSWYDAVLFNGSNGALVSIVTDCLINAFTHYGLGLVGDTTTPQTFSALMVDKTVMNGNINGSSGAVAGLYVQQAGAVQLSNSDIIQCNNNVLFAPVTSSGQVVASVYCVNSYFDSSYGSCVKLGGTQPIVRCQFIGCSFTLSGNAAAGSAALEISNTAANAPAGIDIIGCKLLNTFNTAATSNGLLVTTGADIQLLDSRIAGWTNGIQATPSSPAGTTRLSIIGNTIGPTGAIKGNTVGVLLNAGAVAYGMVQLVDNVFPMASAYGAANGTNLIDNSVVAAGYKTINNNLGLPIAPGPNPAAQLLAAATTYVTPPFPVQANSLRVGTKIRFTINVTNAATLNNTTILAKAGTAGTTADTTVVTTAATTGTAAVGAAEIVVEMTVRSVGAAGVLVGKARFLSTGGFGGTATSQVAVLATATINTTVANFLGVALTTSAASVVTVHEATAEVVSQ